MISRSLLLALAWCALSGELTAAAALEGLVLGWLALRLARVRPSVPLGTALARLPAALRLLAFFLWELLVANVSVALAVLFPARRVHPAIVAVPLDVRSDAGITLLANLVTLTPGTLALDVSADRGTLYVHALSAPDPAALVREIKTGFERRVLEVLP
jgi:multicomponent Na+:H+ antiporter subunit E